MFKIGDFSKICRVPVTALRYYADLGLLPPAQIDAATGYRYYALDQLPRLNRILALKDLGLSLTVIAQLLDETISPAEIQGMLRLKEAEAEQELQAVQERLNRVRARLRQMEQENNLPVQEVVIKAIEPQLILSIRETIPTGQHVEYLFRETAGSVIAQGVVITAPLMTIFHDAEFKEADLDIEIAYPVQKTITIPLDGDRQLVSRELEMIPMAACILHVGDYDFFPDTYTVLGRWIDTNGYRISGQPREIYLRPPGENEAALTEIQYPIEKET